MYFQEVFVKFMRLSVLVLSAALSFAAMAEGKYKPGKYQIDPMHGKVGFEIPHLVISTVEGTFKTYEGTIDLNDKFDKSKVTASVDIASLDSGVSKRDDHLKSPDFFDAAKFPKMKFESTEITGSPDSFKMTGNLTIKGVTKKVTFDGKFLGAVNDGMGNDKTAFTATTAIKRADFGLTWNKAIEAGPVVGDTATITLKIEAARPVAKK
jgi:polyisoprenoid-binding protein YceI